MKNTAAALTLATITSVSASLHAAKVVLQAPIVDNDYVGAQSFAPSFSEKELKHIFEIKKQCADNRISTGDAENKVYGLLREKIDNDPSYYGYDHVRKFNIVSTISDRIPVNCEMDRAIVERGKDPAMSLFYEISDCMVNDDMSPEELANRVIGYKETLPSIKDKTIWEQTRITCDLMKQCYSNGASPEYVYQQAYEEFMALYENILKNTARRDAILSAVGHRAKKAAGMMRDECGYLQEDTSRPENAPTSAMSADP